MERGCNGVAIEPLHDWLDNYYLTTPYLHPAPIYITKFKDSVGYTVTRTFTIRHFKNSLKPCQPPDQHV